MGGTVNETVKLILSLSISGGLFALVLFALKPFIRNRLSKTFQYYIWLVVLLRFMLPFSFGINLMDFTFNTPNAPQTENETIIPDNPVNPVNINPAVNSNAVNNNKPDITKQHPSTQISTDITKPFGFIETLADNLLWIWLAGMVLSAAFNIIGYLRFIQYIHGTAYGVEVPDCGAKVYKSRFMPTPMLVGVIKPRVYLPDTEYTDNQLNNILLHELTHLRRHDIWLKWFVALVVSIHWFNPIVYFMRRELNRACELSCDETVIRNLDGAAKQSYGDTLILVVAESRYPVGVISTTMCDEKKKLKERLISIMNYKEKTKIVVLFTTVLTVAITGSALTFGANAAGRALPEKALTSTAEDTKSILDTYYSGQSTGAFEMLNKKIFVNLIDDWTAEIEDIENPVWNYDSFAGYQFLDHNMLSVSRYEELYYCTFSADNDKSGYVVMSYDGSSLQKISAVETPYLYDLRVNIDEIIDKLKETDMDLSSVTASRVKWVDTDKNRSDEAIVFLDDSGNAYVCCFDEFSLEWNSASQIISLADLRQLAAKGYDLTFEDFSGYKGQEVGSGLYILCFNIEGGYTLYVGGGSPNGKPFYVYLSIPGVEGEIDIRYSDIDEFIGKSLRGNSSNDSAATRVGELGKSDAYKLIAEMAEVDTSLSVTEYTDEIVAICDAANTNIFYVLSDAAIVEPSDPLYAFAAETLNYTSSELFADAGINPNERPHMSAYASWSRYDTDEEIEAQRGDMSDGEWNAFLNDIANYPPNIAAYKGVAYFVFYNIIDKDSLTIDERDLMLKMVKSDMQDYIERLHEEELFNDNFEAVFLEELKRVAAKYSNERMMMECEMGNVEGFAPGQHLQ